MKYCPRGSWESDFHDSVEGRIHPYAFWGSTSTEGKPKLSLLAYFGGGVWFTVSINRCSGVVAIRLAAAEGASISVVLGYCWLFLMLAVAGHSRR